MYASIKYWVWLADLLPTAVGHRVYQFFNSPIEAFLAEPERYDLIPGLTRQQKELLCHASLDRADSILEECARKEIRVVTWQDADYPERLRSMPAPPLVVYAQGKPCHFDDEVAIAMAGTRRASPYGRRMARDIACELTQMGSLVVTGIVAGCDLSAARGALETGQPLVCVLAGFPLIAVVLLLMRSIRRMVKTHADPSFPSASRSEPNALTAEHTSS